MGLYLMTQSGEIPIPSGGANIELLNRICQMEEKIEEIASELSEFKKSRADKTNYGLVRLSDASSVTNSDGLALPSSEKNAAISGTLANLINAAKISSVGANGVEARIIVGDYLYPKALYPQMPVVPVVANYTFLIGMRKSDRLCFGIALPIDATSKMFVYKSAENIWIPFSAGT